MLTMALGPVRPASSKVALDTTLSFSGSVTRRRKGKASEITCRETVTAVPLSLVATTEIVFLPDSRGTCALNPPCESTSVSTPETSTLLAGPVWPYTATVSPGTVAPSSGANTWRIVPSNAPAEERVGVGGTTVKGGCEVGVGDGTAVARMVAVGSGAGAPVGDGTAVGARGVETSVTGTADGSGRGIRVMHDSKPAADMVTASSIAAVSAHWRDRREWVREDLLSSTWLFTGPSGAGIAGMRCGALPGVPAPTQPSHRHRSGEPGFEL